jgi:O-Antigen ligase
VQRLRLDLVVPALLAVTLVAFAAGSSSVAGAVHVGHAARWAALFALFVASAALALERQSIPRLRVSVVLAGAAFLVVAVESTLWSVDPRLTFERGATFVVLLLTAAALAAAYAEGARPVLWGIVAGAMVVTALGLFVLAFDHADAVQAATYDVPARYRGFGLNPDTVSLLLALCLPVTVWLAFQARSRRHVVVALVAAIGFDASIAASGSRGAIAAGFAGALVVAVLVPATTRARIVTVAALVLMAGATIGVALAPTSKGNEAKPKTPSAPAAASSMPKAGYVDVGVAYPFEFDIGSQGPGEAAPTHRTLFGLSGRGEAWRGALDLGDARPTLGYGFGTEDRVFVNRYTNFVGGSPEDSYIGMYLQLGMIGLAALLVLVGSLVVGALRGRRRPEAAVSLGVITAALVLAVVQSYIYSVGDIGTVTVWVCAFVGAAAAGRRVAT